MRRLRFAALFLLASPAYAVPGSGPQGPWHYFTPADLGISAATLSSAPSVTLDVGAYVNVTFTVVLTRVAATAFKATCVAGPATGVTAPLTVATVGGSGSITHADATFDWTGVSTTRNFRVSVGPLNDRILTCTFSGTGATSDTISVHARAASGVR